jgi:hypothetical protein
VVGIDQIRASIGFKHDPRFPDHLIFEAQELQHKHMKQRVVQAKMDLLSSVIIGALGNGFWST